MQSFFKTLSLGQQYMKLWPMRKELYALFPECRVISATRFGVQWMPPVAILSATLLLNHFGSAHIPQTLTMVLLILGLPLQGLWWLGQRADSQLPPQLVNWYQEIYQKLREHGCQMSGYKGKPRYWELAGLLKRAFSELDQAFTRECL
ncbi:UPF0208 membrane protein [Saliniradius amylolyticus]|uniref:UPF0208 membrane protein YfbV n=1 Tax=Saliniradius amylolyticus TaxID=2183582 RepID=A0A2S2E367_9ALTE|nr:terminus macrodomain insulation protein YfbV [Saliniradius amylolyticus]AWL12083.1 UPF0208 membrane protein [Saliniradius amylolyticus]